MRTPKQRIMLCVAALAAAMPTGCTTLENIADSPIARQAFESGLRIIAYSVARNNPDLAPAIYGMADVITNIEQALTPQSVSGLVEAHIDSVELGDFDRRDLRMIANELMSVYDRVYAIYAPDTIPPADVQELFAGFAVAIQTGVGLAGDGAGMVAAAGLRVELTRVELLIR